MKNLAMSRAPIYYALILAIFVLHAIFLSCVAEDSHITFRYAKHFAEGHGIVWNIGEFPPVEGYTNFLWLVIVSGFIWAGLDIFFWSVATGIFAAIITIELSRRFALRFLGCSRVTSLIPALFLALSGPMATWAASGMETALFGLMVMSSVYFYVAYCNTSSRLELSISFAAAFLATLLRPEGLMIFCLLMGFSVAANLSRMREMIIDHLLPVLVFSIPFGIYIIWRLSYFGDPLPNTFYAKTGGGLEQYIRGVQYFANFSGYYLLPLSIPVLLSIWELGVRRVSMVKTLTHWRQFCLENSAWLVTSMILLVYSAYIVTVGGDYMAMYRFLVPILPFVYLLLASLVGKLTSEIAVNRRKTVLAALTIGIAVLATFFHSTPFEEKVFKQPGRQHGHYRGVQTERWHVARLATIGRFFDEYKHDSNDRLATRAIGAIGYYAEMQIDDLMGLTDPVIAHKQSEGAGKGWAGHEKLDLDYSFGRLPTFLMFDRNLQANLAGADAGTNEDIDVVSFMKANYPAGARRFSGWIGENIEFVDTHYKMTSVWMIDDYNKEEGYFSFLELRNR